LDLDIGLTDNDRAKRINVYETIIGSPIDYKYETANLSLDSCKELGCIVKQILTAEKLKLNPEDPLLSLINEAIVLAHKLETKQTPPKDLIREGTLTETQDFWISVGGEVASFLSGLPFVGEAAKQIGFDIAICLEMDDIGYVRMKESPIGDLTITYRFDEERAMITYQGPNGGISIVTPVNSQWVFWPVTRKELLLPDLDSYFISYKTECDNLIQIESPVELRVYDSSNRVTGIIEGDVREEIPNSMYCESDEIVTILFTNDCYTYEVVGTEKGTYGLNIISVADGNDVVFVASDIPTSPDTDHVYTVDWDALSNGGEGVCLDIDANGDGLFEKTIYADNDLTAEEFAMQMSFDPNEPNALKIQNFLKQYQAAPNDPLANQGLLTYVEKAGNLNGIDSNDIFYIIPGENSSKIVSLIPRKNLQNEIIGFYELSKDTRPFLTDTNDPNSNVSIELSFYNPDPNDPNINSENYLRFYIADVNSFEGKPITIQQVSLDPDIEYPVWDIRNIIKKNNRKLPLEDLEDQKPNIAYAYFTLSTNRGIEDINGDGIIDLNDHDLILQNFGQQGIYRSDIAGSEGTGLPDGIVNELDGRAFFIKYIELNPDESIVNPYDSKFKEDFEIGDFSNFNWEFPGDADWHVNTTQQHSGRFSAQAGLIEDNESSILRLFLDCNDGDISFYYKVSSEENYDKLFFFIDRVEKGQWSGEHEWTFASFPVTAGIRTFEWVYSKDSSSSYYSDTAWIDDIVFPLN